MEEKYKIFLDELNNAKKEGLVTMLYRGETKKFAFEKFNLDASINKIEQFAERLFFFGVKAKDFWNEKIVSDFEGCNFGINDTSEQAFIYIFRSFNKLTKTANKTATIRYFEKNKNTVDFFSNLSNLGSFSQKVRNLPENKKLHYRNYCLRIIHQLDETSYNKNSHFVSSTQSEEETKQFSKGEIKINFWDLKFTKKDVYFNDVPCFIGRPYEKQDEISIFAAIFPHYIYSFEYKGYIYPNPALRTCKDIKCAIYCGFEIQQENFLERLKNETKYKKGVMTNGEKIEEISMLT